MSAAVSRLSTLPPVVAMTLVTAALAAAPADAAPPIRYRVSFPAPHTHYVAVEATVPTAGRDEVELMMAVWTPGSYLVREFARHVEGLTATTPGGVALEVAKSRKNRWRVSTGGAASIALRYRVYGREMSVRTNWVESSFAMLNGAPTFVTLVESSPVTRPHEVVVDLPPGWRSVATALDPLPGVEHGFVAADFDTLVDSPILAGSPSVHAFDVDGIPHALVNIGDDRFWDGARAAADVGKIVRATRDLWGGLPYPRYLFLNVIAEAGGGLEHKDSTLIMSSRWTMRTPRRYQGWLGLVAHEFFHAWNVKRLRPAALGPFDYEREVYTTDLWIAEGLTSYYDDLLVLRAGLSTRDEYLAALSNQIQALQTTPGRLVQPVADASYDAWIRHYRPDENSPNVAVSYYTKGAVVGFLLDMRVREATRGAKSLDDVMRLAYERFSGDRGYTEADFRRTASEVAGVDLASWFARTVDSTEELDYDAALAWLGLRFRVPGEARTDRGWLGAQTKADAGRLVVSQVRRGTPAHDAGLNVDDEIVGVDDYRVRVDQLDDRLQQYRPGDEVTLLVARRDALLRLQVVLGAEPPSGWRLERRPDITADQRARLDAWLVGPRGVASAADQAAPPDDERVEPGLHEAR